MFLFCADVTESDPGVAYAYPRSPWGSGSSARAPSRPLYIQPKAAAQSPPQSRRQADRQTGRQGLGKGLGKGAAPRGRAKGQRQGAAPRRGSHFQGNKSYLPPVVLTEPRIGGRAPIFAAVAVEPIRGARA